MHIWVLNLSEKEGKELINPRDMAPGAASGGQLFLGGRILGATSLEEYYRGDTVTEGRNPLAIN